MVTGMGTIFKTPGSTVKLYSSSRPTFISDNSMFTAYRPVLEPGTAWVFIVTEGKSNSKRLGARGVSVSPTNVVNVNSGFDSP